MGAAIAVILLIAVISFATLRHGHVLSDQLARGIAEAAASAGPTTVAERPIVLTSNRLLPQILYDDVGTYAWVSADDHALPGYAAQLAAAGAHSAVLVLPTGSDVPKLLSDAGWTIRAADPSAVYDIFVIERTEP